MRRNHLFKNLAAITLFFIFTLLTLFVSAKETNSVFVDSTDAENSPPWEHFGDPVLSSLVKQGLADNPGVKAARERIDMAVAASKIARSSLLPMLSAEGVYGLNSYDSSLSGISMPSIPGATPQGNDINHTEFLTASLKATYMIDITGRNYKAREAALKDVEAGSEDAQTISSQLVTRIMKTYYDVVAARERLTLIDAQVENNEKLLKLVMEQFKRGIANSLDVLQQRQQLNAKRAQRPLALTALNLGREQLAMLAGLNSVDELADISGKIPGLGTTPGDISADKLEQLRPDLRAAKYRIEAFENRTSSTQRGLFPTLAINGQVGYKVMHVQDTNHGDIWSVGALLSVPLYMGGLNHAKLEQARAAERNTRFMYEDSKRQAVTQVKNAIETEMQLRQYLSALQLQTEAARQTVLESQKRYIGGLSTYLNVLASNSALQINELNVIAAKQNLVSARINLLGAIGGNWTKKLVKTENYKN